MHHSHNTHQAHLIYQHQASPTARTLRSWSLLQVSAPGLCYRPSNSAAPTLQRTFQQNREHTCCPPPDTAMSRANRRRTQLPPWRSRTCQHCTFGSSWPASNLLLIRDTAQQHRESRTSGLAQRSTFLWGRRSNLREAHAISVHEMAAVVRLSSNNRSRPPSQYSLPRLFSFQKG
jgi:hypothetical protein